MTADIIAEDDDSEEGSEIELTLIRIQPIT
jgi:hypothetical protein